MNNNYEDQIEQMECFDELLAYTKSMLENRESPIDVCALFIAVIAQNDPEIDESKTISFLQEHPMEAEKVATGIESLLAFLALFMTQLEMNEYNSIDLHLDFVERPKVKEAFEAIGNCLSTTY